MIEKHLDWGLENETPVYVYPKSNCTRQALSHFNLKPGKYLCLVFGFGSQVQRMVMINLNLAHSLAYLVTL